jgi:hypothetical protein
MLSRLLPGRLLLPLLLPLSLVLSSCGGERETVARSTPLSPPAAAQLAPAQCQDGADLQAGPVVHRRQGELCLRSSTLFDDPAPAAGARKRTLATAPTRLVTVSELFDWAETEFKAYFPSHRNNLQLASYTYRYYPESQNHLAVSDGLVYVQGPISGGELLFVGSVEQFTCMAKPSLCGQAQDCAPISQWSVGALQCRPNEGQGSRIAHGATFSFIDTVGPTTGSATYRCDDGTLQLQAGATCEQAPPAACNTAGLNWTFGTLTCHANAGEPVQMASGTSRTFTASAGNVGSATYSCTDGALTLVGTPSCQPPPPVNCTNNAISWQVEDRQCFPDTVPAQIAENATYLFIDTVDGPVGTARYRCLGGTLVPEGAPLCNTPTVPDSFGGDGGAADGGANGDGSAADGAPIVGGAVRVTDTTGRVATATTDHQGYFRVKLTGMVPPLVVRVTRPDGVLRHSVSTQPLRINGYIFMAVTGLTDKIVSDLANAAGFSSPAALTPSMLAQLGTGAVDNAVVALQNNAVVRSALVGAGLNPDTFDPLSTPFRPNGTGYDQVLDNLVIESDGDGSTTIRSLHCAISQLSWTVNDNTCTFGGSTSVFLGSGSSLTFQDGSGPTRGSARFTCDRGVILGPFNATCTLQP